MKKILIIILITLPQFVLSQTVTIKDGETVLDQKKTIDVAKIIKNEGRLRLEVKKLMYQIVSLNDSIDKVKKKNLRSLEIIDRLSGVVDKQYNDINELNRQNLAVEKRKSNNGAYVYFSVGSDLEAFKTFDLGFKYVTSKTIYSFTVDPTQRPNPVYKVGVGLKFW